MIKYKTITQFAAESGYTEHAIRAKIRDGIWARGHVWIAAPDGRKLISVEGFNEWAEQQRGEAAAALEPSALHQSKSSSCITASAAAKGSNLSPPPLI